MVEHEDVIYVFGGELSFCNDQETPLWMYSIKVIIMMIVMMIIMMMMCPGEQLGEVLRAPRRGDAEGSARAHGGGARGVHVRVRRLPGPARLLARAVGPAPPLPHLAPRVPGRAANEPSRRLKLYNHGAFSWLKVATTTFTFKTLC